MTGVARVWSGFGFWMVGEIVEFEENFSLWLVFMGEVVESVGSQSFEGENGLGFAAFFECFFMCWGSKEWVAEKVGWGGKETAEEKLEWEVFKEKKNLFWKRLNERNCRRVSLNKKLKGL